MAELSITKIKYLKLKAYYISYLQPTNFKMSIMQGVIDNKQLLFFF